MKTGNIVYLPFVLFGSGTPYPIGAFDNKEDMNRELDVLGRGASYVLELPLNHNWELWRREFYRKQEEEEKIVEAAKPKPEWEEIVNNNSTTLRRLDPEMDQYNTVGHVFRMANNKHRFGVYVDDFGNLSEDFKNRKKAIKTLKDLVVESETV